MRANLSTVAHFSLLSVVSVVLLSACAEKQKVAAAPMRADPDGLGVVIAEPVISVAAGTSCGETVTQGAAERFKSATAGALTKAGFAVVTDEKEQAFIAQLELEIDYCSDAGVVSGTTALQFKRKTGASVWRGQAVGDQARGETASSTVSELVEGMLFDPRVIKATKEARSN